MDGNGRADALDRLKRLTDDAGGVVEKAIAPLDEALCEIDVPFRASHFAEDCADWGTPESGCLQAHASRFAFALETAGGRVIEYSLCSARGPDGRCGLYVSVCEHHVVSEQGEDADPNARPDYRVEIDRIYLAKPGELSLWLRVQMLDELTQGHFIRTFKEHVRETAGEPPEEAMNRYWLPSRSG